jgi:hypothetical protein
MSLQVATDKLDDVKAEAVTLAIMQKLPQLEEAVSCGGGHPWQARGCYEACAGKFEGVDSSQPACMWVSATCTACSVPTVFVLDAHMQLITDVPLLLPGSLFSCSPLPCATPAQASATWPLAYPLQLADAQANASELTTDPGRFKMLAMSLRSCALQLHLADEHAGRYVSCRPSFLFGLKRTWVMPMCHARLLAVQAVTGCCLSHS